MRKVLLQVDTWLEAASVHAAERNFPTTVLMTARLAPDQWPFARHVGCSCDCATQLAALLSGREDEPKHTNTEKTFEELSGRIRSAVQYLDGFSAKDFDRDPSWTRAWWYDQVMAADDFFLENGLPNFFFHLSHAYAILRHNGIRLVKEDFLGPMSLKNA
jgi:hypothetical protein